MKALAPGKLILTGEHAVVYGKPAIAMAINYFVSTSITAQASNTICFNFLNLNQKMSVALQTLMALKKQCVKDYQAFLQGKFTINNVLKLPINFAQFALTFILEHLGIELSHGLKVTINSTVPIGSGMGSSAALALSIIHAVSSYFDIKLDKNKYLDLGMEIEKLQHGRTSGLDIYTSLVGGCLFFQNGRIEPRSLPKLSFYLVNTGVPAVSTGECVAQVAKKVSPEALIWQQFEAITHAMDDALQKQNIPEIQTLIRENHRLLKQIGVVPSKIQHFIEAIEKKGAAAKVCGAGAVAGEAAGAVLVVTDSIESIAPLCQQYQLPMPLPVQAEAYGVRMLDDDISVSHERTDKPISSREIFYESA